MECEGFDPEDQMRRYLKWFREGHLSSTGRCFDIGNTVRSALLRFERPGDPYSGSTDPYSAGNGSLMRLVPIPPFFAGNPRLAIERAADSSRTTHGAREAVDVCRYYTGLILGALHGVFKEELLSETYSPVLGVWEDAPLAPKIQEIVEGSFKVNEPPQIRGGGYVVESLEAALWALQKSKDYREGALLAVNLGDDADTTVAVYGQLSGAYYGEGGIPEGWIEKVAMREYIVDLTDTLFTLASLGSSRLDQ